MSFFKKLKKKLGKVVGTGLKVFGKVAPVAGMFPGAGTAIAKFGQFAGPLGERFSRRTRSRRQRAQPSNMAMQIENARIENEERGGPREEWFGRRFPMPRRPKRRLAAARRRAPVRRRARRRSY